MAAQPPRCLSSLQALWEAPLEEVAVAVLAGVFGSRMAADPFPLVSEHEPGQFIISWVPETRDKGGFIKTGPEFSTARRVAAEAVALLEVNLLLVREFSTDSTHLSLTRRGHVALQSGNPAAALTVAR